MSRVTEPAESDRCRQLVAWLESRAPGEPVTTAETHISILAFQNERVYKLKKAVRFPFIDLSTAALRLEDCQRELDLNRRLAPDVYLDLDAVTDDAGNLVDHVVVMRRMPDAQRLAALAMRSDAAIDCIERVARVLAQFHERAPTGGAIDAAATRDSVAGLWHRGLAEIPDSGNIRPLVDEYLAGRTALFDARIASHRSRDGHGDLLADDVFCLADGPRILDCLEFDERLRFGDVLLDVAFLAMDLERLGRPDLARRFLDDYRAVAGDSWPSSLEHFYIAYRAHVRARVAAMSDDPDGSRARLAIAVEHLRRGRVRLVLVGGAPATGKTTLARAIAGATGWRAIRSDEVRKSLAGIATTERSGAELDDGLYTPAWTERTYTELLERAQERLGLGESLILDASWSDRRWRARVVEVARATSSELIALQCTSPVEIAIVRAEKRKADQSDASDADAKIARAGAERFHPWPQAQTLDTTQAPDEVERTALSMIGPF